MSTIPIERGWSVYTEDNKRVGDVVEVHGHYLLVSRGLLVVRDIYVPRYAVASVEERKVQLAITEGRLRGMDWGSAPPVPPPTEGRAAPRLVPNPASDDEQESGDALAGDASGVVSAQDNAEDSPYDVDLALFGLDSTTYSDYEDMGVVLGGSIEVDGEAFLSYEKIGLGPAVVLIHGWGFDHRIWDRLLLDLPRDFTVVVYDARGYGRSTGTWNGYDTTRAARDLRVILRTLDVEDATLVGLDIGASAALRYVQDGGRRAGRLILLSPALPPESIPVFDENATSPPPFDDWARALREDRPVLAERLAALWAPGVSPQTLNWLRDGFLDAAPYALHGGIETLAHPWPDLSLAAATVPVTIVQAADDPIVALDGVRKAADEAGARFIVLDGNAHLPMLTDPARIAAVITAQASPGGEETAPPSEEETAPPSEEETAPPTE